MVRNKNVVVPVTQGQQVAGPNSNRGGKTSPSGQRRFLQVFENSAGTTDTAKAGEQKRDGADSKIKRPPKPQVELGLIDPPQNRTLKRLLEVLLGDSYLAGHVRRLPDGTIAKPRLVVTPKASQHSIGALIAGQILPLLLVVWTLVGLWCVHACVGARVRARCCYFAPLRRTESP